jgi:hypothetical protein
LIIGQEPLIGRYNLNAVEPDFPDKDIFEDLQRLKPESGLYETVKELKRKADTGELEVKVYKRNFLHAKCYIFGNYKTEKAIGIIGSSNFTKNGLTSNLELNTGESDNRIIQFVPQTEVQENGHLSWFDEIWSDEMSVNWTGEFTELINTSNHGDEIFSPYEMYIKTLEYIYSDEVEESKDIKQLQGKTLQAFQERNIKQLIKRLDKYKVAMLHLGIATALELEGYTLVLAFLGEGAILTLLAHVLIGDLRIVHSLAILFVLPVVLSVEIVFAAYFGPAEILTTLALCAVLGGIGVWLHMRYPVRGADMSALSPFGALAVIGSLYGLLAIWRVCTEVFFVGSSGIIVALVIYTCMGIWLYVNATPTQTLMRTYGGSLRT